LGLPERFRARAGTRSPRAGAPVMEATRMLRSLTLTIRKRSRMCRDSSSFRRFRTYLEWQGSLNPTTPRNSRKAR
jgi:hypothetical protein